MPHSPSKPLSDAERLRLTAATHSWVGAVTIPLSPGQARTGNLRAAVTLKADTKVHVLDAYCSACKRNWEAVAREECPAKVANEHLRGGPIRERKKRGRQVRQDDEARAS